MEWLHFAIQSGIYIWSKWQKYEKPYHSQYADSSLYTVKIIYDLSEKADQFFKPGAPADSAFVLVCIDCTVVWTVIKQDLTMRELLDANQFVLCICSSLTQEVSPYHRPCSISQAKH